MKDTTYTEKRPKDSTNERIKVTITQLSTVHGILQARILDSVAIPFPRQSTQPRDQTQVSCIAGRFFTVWATREATQLSSRFVQLLFNFLKFSTLAL